MKYIGSVRAFK